jgi:nucleoside 2-deoxyribosyltransferase
MKIYFSGSMTFNHDKAKFYKMLIDLLNNYGKVLNEFVGDEKVINYDPKFIFERDTNNMANSDILIADISYPSLGVGFELGYYLQFNKPLLVLYDNNLPLPSASGLGLPNSTIYGYENELDAKMKVKKFMEEVKNG